MSYCEICGVDFEKNDDMLNRLRTARDEYHAQRDEARAEVERLKKERDAERDEGNRLANWICMIQKSDNTRELARRALAGEAAP